MSIYEKLLNIQSELKAPKGQYNNFGKYKYRSCEDILEAVKPLCVKNSLCLTLTDSVELIGNRYYIKATAVITDGESKIGTTAYAREDESKKGMDGSQITGSASSYARKYALNGLFVTLMTQKTLTRTNRQKQRLSRANRKSRIVRLCFALNAESLLQRLKPPKVRYGRRSRYLTSTECAVIVTRKRGTDVCI